MRSSHMSASVIGITVLTLAGSAWAAPPSARATSTRTLFETIPFGETRTIVRNGPISIEAKCETGLQFEPDGPFFDRIRLLAKTSVPGAVAQLESGFLPNGAGDFLDPDTVESDRRFADVERSSGNPTYQNERDDGSVVAPSGEVILIDGETPALSLLGEGGPRSGRVRASTSKYEDGREPALTPTLSHREREKRRRTSPPLGLGLNIFGADCLVVGTYHAFKGRL